MGSGLFCRINCSRRKYEKRKELGTCRLCEKQPKEGYVHCEKHFKKMKGYQISRKLNAEKRLQHHLERMKELNKKVENKK